MRLRNISKLWTVYNSPGRGQHAIHTVQYSRVQYSIIQYSSNEVWSLYYILILVGLASSSWKKWPHSHLWEEPFLTTIQLMNVESSSPGEWERRREREGERGEGGRGRREKGRNELRWLKISKNTSTRKVSQCKRQQATFSFKAIFLHFSYTPALYVLHYNA